MVLICHLSFKKKSGHRQGRLRERKEDNGLLNSPSSTGGGGGTRMGSLCGLKKKFISIEEEEEAREGEGEG